MKSSKIFPILFGFFIMGFVDVVGVATNYIKNDFQLSDSLANLLPMMVFLWFVVCSIPTGILMEKQGKKNTVLISLTITIIALIIPFCFYSFAFLLLAFGLLGISNTMLQVSLNPMVASVVNSQRIASVLTLGQFIKAISSFLGPLLAGAAAIYWSNWKLIFLIYSFITMLSIVWTFVCFDKKEEKGEVVTASWKTTLALLNDRYILFLFLGILLIVGIDVGMNTSIPKLLMDKTSMELSEAGIGISIYFAARICGAFVGSILLIKISAKKFLRYTMYLAICCFIVLAITSKTEIMLAMFFIIGLSCANVFSIIFSYALQHNPKFNNEISALMIMGVSGGALVLPIMGIVSDKFGQTIGMTILMVGIVYLIFLSFILPKPHKI